MKAAALASVFFITAIAAFPESFQEGKIQRDGFALHYRMYGGGEPLLILAGGPGYDCDYMEPVARELSSGNRIILVELRGTGRSVPPAINASTVSLDLYLADLEALRIGLQLDHWSILGHSAGANLAMTYAITFPSRVTRLVLVDSGPVRGSSFRAINDNLKLRYSPEELSVIRKDPSFVALLRGYFFEREKAAKMAAEFRPASHHEAAGELVAAGLMDPSMDLRPELQKLAMPALVIAGRQDPTDPGMQYDIHLALKGSQLIILDRCGHYSWLEQPGEFYRQIRSFLISQ